MSSDLTPLEMAIIWYIYKVDKATIDKMSRVTRVSREEISSTVNDLIRKGYIALDSNGMFVLTTKAFNSIWSFPDEIKNIPIESPREKTTESKYEERQKYEERHVERSVATPSVVEVKLPEKKGSIGLGAFATFMISVLFGFIPVIGWLASFFGGLVGGLIAKGAGRGALAGFLGIFVALIIWIIALGTLSSELGAGFSTGATIGGLTGGVLLFFDFLLAIIGGIIGGAINR